MGSTTAFAGENLEHKSEIAALKSQLYEWFGRLLSRQNCLVLRCSKACNASY
jgi:hypothetical protein